MPLSEGIPILAAKLTDMLRAFYVLSVILVLGAMMMSAKWLTRNDKLLKGAIGKLSPAVGGYSFVRDQGRGVKSERRKAPGLICNNV